MASTTVSWKEMKLLQFWIFTYLWNWNRTKDRKAEHCVWKSPRSKPECVGDDPRKWQSGLSKRQLELLCIIDGSSMTLLNFSKERFQRKNSSLSNFGT
ncbi:hypothetical protein TNIN_261571 [Trichonephila inaurata madagascariensis]|uniref:Uncharacterized protein n=1 Tax=Trichonephila inaurata madagascariensis TaxID=2747483 RepID=A0A8X7CHF8_9ARAC|nr:hypothetical protein TNIN_261571 [Trichonephila inaurata madagascariensis]